MDSATANLGRRMVRGAGWTVLMRIAVRAIGIVSTVILARLLVPGDFGLVALATMLIALLEVVSEMNFAVFLVREPTVGRSHYDTAWTLSVLRGVVIAALLAAGAPAAAAFFGEARLAAVCQALALSVLVSGCANIGIVDFQRSLDFRKEFQLLVRTRIVSFCVTVVLAFVLRDYWALVFGIMSGQLVRVVLSYHMHPYRPRPSLARVREIMRFSRWLLANSVLNFANRRSDVVVIGRLLDSATLGFYTVAREIAELASTELVAPIHRAVLPGLSRLAHDGEAMRRAFIDTQSVIVLLALPIAAGLGLVADPLVRVALGDQWIGAIPLIHVLAVAGIFRVCRASTAPFMIASGHPHLTTLVAGAGAAAGIVALLIGVSGWGVAGAPWAIVATGLIQLLLTYIVLFHNLGIATMSLARAVWRSFAACLPMSWVVWEFLALWSGTETVPWLLAALLGAIAAGALAYIGALVALWRLCGAPDGPERRLLGFLEPAMARRWLPRSSRRTFRATPADRRDG